MTPEEFIKEIGHSGRKAFYIITGGERSAIKCCLKAAEESVDESFRDFNFQLVEVDSGQAGRLAAEASTMPFFTPPRMVICKNPQFSADDWNIISAYLESPNTDSCLIVLLDKVDTRLKFFKNAKSNGLIVDCEIPKGAALRKWLIDQFKIRGVILSPNAAELMIERAGSDPQILSGEAEKLSLYVGEGGKVSPELISSLVALANDANIFALGEALGARNGVEALKTLLELLNTEHPLPILAMIVRHFRIMLSIKTRQSLLGQNYLNRNEASSLGIHPFVLEKTQRQAAQWSWRNLSRALTILEDAHRALVTSPAPPQIIMENLAVKLASFT